MQLSGNLAKVFEVAAASIELAAVFLPFRSQAYGRKTFVQMSRIRYTSVVIVMSPSMTPESPRFLQNTANCLCETTYGNALNVWHTVC